MSTSHEDRVLQLAKTGKINDAEAQRLIDALRSEPLSWRFLISPYDQLSTQTAWLIAAAVVIGSVAASRLGIRFDGALDMQKVSEAPSLFLAIFDNINAIAVTGCLMWLSSLLANKQGRIVDFVVFIAIARVPLVIAGVLLGALMPPPEEILAQASANQLNVGLILLSVILALPSLVWFLVLLFQAFKISSGMKGIRLGISFTVAILAAEIATKFLLITIAQWG
jgi:hypothetical protein